jgi:hypothetical protein
MNRWKCFVLLVGIGAILAISPAFAAEKAADCGLVTFEGIAENAPVDSPAGHPTVTFGASWRAVINSDAGGIGDFDNEPSPSTIVYLLNEAETKILFDPPVQFVEFWYTASGSDLPLGVVAYGSDGIEIVAEDTGTTDGTIDCPPGSNGTFCRWDTITLAAVGNKIASVQILGAATYDFGIDDLEYCTQPMVACCLDGVTCVQVTEQECTALNGFPAGEVDCGNVDCEPVPSDSATWGTLKGSYR